MQFAGASILIQLPPGANAHKTANRANNPRLGPSNRPRWVFEPEIIHWERRACPINLVSKDHQAARYQLDHCRQYS